MTIEPIYSMDAEKAVLGAVLINPEVFKSIDLRDADFYRVEHQELWRAYQDIVLSGGLIDVLTVGEKVKNADLIDIISDVPSSLHAKEYAEIVREKARRRELVNMAGEIAKMAYDSNSDLEQEIPGFMTRLVAGAKMASGAEHVSKSLSELYEEIKARYDDPKDLGHRHRLLRLRHFDRRASQRRADAVIR